MHGCIPINFSWYYLSQLLSSPIQTKLFFIWGIFWPKHFAFLTNTFYSRECFKWWVQHPLAQWAPWVLLSTLTDVPDSGFQSFLRAVFHSLQLSIILTLLSLQLTFHIQKGVFTLFSASLICCGHMQSILNRPSRTQLLESLGGWHQHQQCMGFIKYISLLQEQCNTQNGAVIFFQCSDKHQHNNSKLHI